MGYTCTRYSERTWSTTDCLCFNGRSTFCAEPRRMGKNYGNIYANFLFGPIDYNGVTSEPVAILANEWGEVSSINPYTGKEYWKTTLPQRIINASPVQKEELVYITGVNGLLSGLDIKTGVVQDQYHFAPTYAYSTPVIVGEQIIQAEQDGVVGSIDLALGNIQKM